MESGHLANINSNKNDAVKQYSFSQKQILITILFAVIIIATLWIGKSLQIHSLKNQYNAREQELIQKTNVQIETTNRHFLKLIAKPYVWAVRTEMMQGNINQVNLYGADIVREKNFISVMVANYKGAIVSSTDKKYEGKSITAISLPFNPDTDSTVVNKVNDSVFVMASPIMSFNSKLGTLIINYSFKTPDWPIKP